MNKYYSSLQIDLILEKIKFYIHTDSGLKLLNESDFYVKYDDFIYESNLLNDALSCFYRNGNMPIHSSKSFIQDVKYLEKGGSISIDAFRKIYNETIMVNELIKYKNKGMSSYEFLSNLMDGLDPLLEVIRLIERVFDDKFMVRDSASDTLLKIRKQLRKIEGESKNIILQEMAKYKDFLTEYSYSIRNNAFVLPVKTSLKSRVNGIVHDISGSRETTFIEPEKCLVASNEIARLTALEKNEIAKILDDLSNEIAPFSEQLIKNNEIVAKLDVLDAKFQYSKEINGVAIKTINDSSINIIDGRHPLIEPDKVVANSLAMTNEDKQLIISGPNAGGKSVFLKLVGIIVLMNQLVIPLPVNEKSTLGFFNHIFLDIGDVQSIQENLSTFSGHILNVVNIINRVSNKDLVLIDELGTGTDPKEGEALAISIAKYLKDQGCKSLITSHFDGLKRYALASKDVLCASMVFDEETLTPKYKLLLGIPGKSYGINIAKKYGLNKTIVKSANEYIESNKLSNDEDYVSILSKKIKDVSDLEIQNIDLNNELKEKSKEYSIKLNDVNEKLKNFNSDISIEKEKIIKETKEKLEDLKKTLIKSGTIKLNDVIDANKTLDELLDNEITYVEKEDTKPIIINVGDYVSYDEFALEGRVVSISNKGYTIITKDGKTYTIDPSNLKKRNVLPQNKNINREKSNIDYMITSSPLSYELNIIGLHVDEALLEVDKYMDNAILKNAKQVRIVHGFGSGALRTAVHDYLKKNKNVKAFNLGGEHDGGFGVTIVNLK